jgi:Domain of Unknown Function with PDB structure (DUF3857)
MKKLTGFLLSLTCYTFLLLMVSSLALAADWLPIAPEDLAMKDNPAVPGSKAMILYRSVERDDTLGSETEYVRLKVFTDEGKEYADVVLPPFDRAEFNVQSVHGRTIHPDGSIVPFSGQVFEKVVAQGRGFKYRAKAFTMPDVTPGSIIEYRFVRYWEASNPSTRMWYYFPRSEWQVQRELYQRAAHFKFKPLTREGLFWAIRTLGLPADAKVAQDKMNDSVTLDVANMPGIEKEEYMPPEQEVTARVLFFYDDARIPMPDEYWKNQAKKWHGSAEGFMDKKGAVSRDLASVISPSDTNDVKLHKIYDHVQSFENRSFEAEKTDKEAKVLNLRYNKSVEDVISSKAGYRNDLNRTFVALARAAGFDATLLKVTERDTAILHKEWPSVAQLGYEIAMVREGSKNTYLDPGSPFCPYGILPWEDTAIPALQLDKNGPVWVTIPPPEPDAAGIKRVAKMKLENDGSLTGEIEVTFSGQEAYRRRLWERNQDDAGRKKNMEELLQEWLEAKGEIELEKVNDWKASSVPLIVDYKLTIPGYANQAGRRVLLPSTLFAGAYKNRFPGHKRVHPIYLEYTYDYADEVNISLPPNFQVESLPKPVAAQNGVADVAVNCANDNGTLHLTRDFKLKGLFLDQKYYDAMREYFQAVQSGANEQAVLKIAN